MDIDEPAPAVHFLHELMPGKPVAELYAALGHHRHGKTGLYRDLVRHLATCDDEFELARGERGLVMAVFTLPSYDVVFKVIRDRFGEPKTMTRETVLAKYQIVFRHDRAGRLVDAQAFEHLRFDRARFSAPVLEELQRTAASSLRVERDTVTLRHLYTERRLTPLDVYLREASVEATRAAALDYGQAIRDLAATNIFTGDLLLKNFGVTRHGRVVFYDYDELALLTDCHFRELPEPTCQEEETASEPWYYVGENDIFPEELLRFMGLRGEAMDAFLAVHADLLRVPFWRDMQARLRAGEIVEVFPYPAERRLRRA